MHNGHGGHFGWSAPLTLTVLPQSPWAGQSAHVFNVKTYGAKGDGVTDDRTAIQATINAAAASGPSTVYFPAGTYMVGGELDPADKVSWLGDGRDKTFIKANASFPTSNSYAFVFSDSSNVNDVEFKNLTLDGNGNLGDKQLLLFRHHDNVKLTNLRLISAPAQSTLTIPI